ALQEVGVRVVRMLIKLIQRLTCGSMLRKLIGSERGLRNGYCKREKNRINKDGELVMSSTKTRTQKGNIEDALQKIQAIIDAASYVPPPPSEEQKKKIEKIAAAAERNRMQNKKVLSQKKESRRNKPSWD
uniref:Prokaryotic-type class I peptide chain release factors domain-containing protein n=1 Tax=Aegilops tauschii subsp. strangulata TaxID=200361 RepID=A0A453IHV5_AEGTS